MNGSRPRHCRLAAHMCSCNFNGAHLGNSVSTYYKMLACAAQTRATSNNAYASFRASLKIVLHAPSGIEVCSRNATAVRGSALFGRLSWISVSKVYPLLFNAARCAEQSMLLKNASRDRPTAPATFVAAACARQVISSSCGSYNVRRQAITSHTIYWGRGNKKTAVMFP